ncbi:MAG: hypothetical protein AAGE65_03460 [Planctomycetota bacterium]
MADFKVDGNAVNNRPDWRHQPPVYAPSSLRFEGFPGTGATVAVQGPLRGVTFTVEGWLQGSDFAELHAATKAASAWLIGTHRVEIQGQVYDGMVLSRPLSPSRPLAFKEGGVIKVRSFVRFVWQSTEGAS